MANLNKVMLIGRLTRDPEAILVKGVQAGAKFGFAVNNRRYNQDKQIWEDVPVFIDMEIWNRGEGKQADRVIENLRRGQQVFIEGHLKMDQWEDKNGGGKRTALRVVVESFQYLEPRPEGEVTPRSPRPAAQTSVPVGRNGRYSAVYGDESGINANAPPSQGGMGGDTDDEIPF